MKNITSNLQLADFFFIQYYNIYYGYIVNVMLVAIFLEQLVEVMVYSCCQKAVFLQNTSDENHASYTCIKSIF